MGHIEVVDLCYSCNGKVILNNVNFRVNENEYIVIIGPNGSGKSTLFRCLMKQLKIKSGSIELYGVNINKLNDFRDIGYLKQNSFESLNGFPATCLEMINLSSRSKDLDSINQVIDIVGLNDLKNNLVSNLSGGEKQRLMLGMLLVNNPKVILLDEPTTGLDNESIALLMDLLDKLRNSGVSIVMITHDIKVVLKYASRFYCLENSLLLELSVNDIINEQNHTHYHPSNKELL